MMSPEQFFNLFLEELKGLPELSHYYKFHTSVKDFEFRKNYFIQRLMYIEARVNEFRRSNTGELSIWDCGCGYGTTCLFLAMNGIATYGTTLEFYYEFLPKRKAYWSQYGNSELFQVGYEDMMIQQPKTASIDIIIVQDTLHHLEPIDQAMTIFQDVLKENGMMICIEENGNNLIQNLKLYKQRGNDRVITFWDEKLQRNITMGNENIRGIKQWEQLFNKASFLIQSNLTEYIRLLPPMFYKNKTAATLALKEKEMGNPLLHKYFYFGINFTAIKKR